MEDKLNVSILDSFSKVDEKNIDQKLKEALQSFHKKIVVLDDDPTGVQTVHDVSVYTDWSEESIYDGFAEKNSMFFVLTNSRGMTVQETEAVHKEIAQNILKVSAQTGKEFLVISRSDSTLRGHYPLETETLKETLEAGLNMKLDGEILLPFFKEGGRFTINNVHYVMESDNLIPAAQTEFAKDKSFGYKASHLGKWCEEKTGGRFKEKDVTYISLEDLRKCETEKITEAMCEVTDFNKIVVNAVDYIDIKVFTIALINAMNRGKNFILRSAAAITKVLGGVSDKPLLAHDELILEENKNGGIIIVGSHVNKTTAQLEELKKSKAPIEFVEFNQHRVLEDKGLEEEVKRVVGIVDTLIQEGKTAAVYTRRNRFDLKTDDKDEQIKVSVKISDAVTSIVTNLTVRPNFIVAKGGITSSDVGTKALAVKKANVMGQIKPGVPVWMTGSESKFPGLPYIIFPGNVGTNETLKDVVERLMGM